MEYFSALKRKEILTRVTAWMNLEDMMLNEIRPDTKRQIIVGFHLYVVSRLVKFIETKVE